MAFDVPLLLELPIICEDNIRFVKFSDVKDWLKKNLRDGDAKFKSFNLFQWLKGKEKHVKEIGGHPVFSLNNFLHFIFAHTKSYNVCNKVALQLQTKILRRFSSSDDCETIEDIYNAAAKLPCLDVDLLIRLPLEEENISTLHMNYKSKFDKFEWRKICLFELHFEKSEKIDIGNETYENLMMKRCEFLKTIQKAGFLSNIILQHSKAEMLHRIKRKQLAEKEDAITLYCLRRHSPEVLENQLIGNIPDSSLVKYLICLDCTKLCKHVPAIHVYVETKQEQNYSSYSIEDICTLICSTVSNLHGEECAEIIFFDENTMSQFESNDGIPFRFQMRDQVNSGQLHDRIRKRWTQRDFCESAMFDEEATTCIQCFGIHTLKPLTLKTFDVLSEWFLETPLVCQIFLETFINKESLRKSDNKTELLTSKYSRLYTLYDALLNIQNRRYCGILQERNTQELAMNYQCVLGLVLDLPQYLTLTSLSKFTFYLPLNTINSYFTNLLRS